MLRTLYLAPYTVLVAVLGFMLYGFAISTQADPEEIAHPDSHFEAMIGLKPITALGEDAVRIRYDGFDIWGLAPSTVYTITASKIEEQHFRRSAHIILKFLPMDRTVLTTRGQELIDLLPAIRAHADQETNCEFWFDSAGGPVIEGSFHGDRIYSNLYESEGCQDIRLKPTQLLESKLQEIMSSGHYLAKP